MVSRMIGKLMLAATMIAGLMTAAQAYTAEQEQMCSGDAMRLCSSEIPNIDRITACMYQRKAQLSPGCRAVFNRSSPADARATPVRATSKPVNLVPSKPKTTKTKTTTTTRSKI